MAAKPVTIEGVKFWMVEFLSEGQGWRSIQTFFRQEIMEGRMESFYLIEAERIYRFYQKMHPTHFKP